MMFSVIPRFFFRLFPLLLILLSTATLAQDNSAFLDCARHSDRGQRIACLEDALEDATSPQSRPVEAAPEPPTSPARPERVERVNPEASVAGGSEDRISSFGREPRIEENEDGRDELHDTVAELQQPRPNQWLITLDSGQAWYQVHTRRYNLREGDEVRIYSSDWGKNYRLETPRLSGFIQVRRVE